MVIGAFSLVLSVLNMILDFPKQLFDIAQREGEAHVFALQAEEKSEFWTMKMEVEGSAVPEDLVKIGGGEYGATLSGLFGESVAYVTDIPVNEHSQATELAKAELDPLARQFCRGTAQIQGDDNVRAGSMVEFSGLPEGQNGKYFVIATRHVISVRSGYTTELTFCSNTMGT